MDDREDDANDDDSLFGIIGTMVQYSSSLDIAAGDVVAAIVVLVVNSVI